MTIFGYPLVEARKTVVAAVIAVLSVVGYFIAFDPSFTQALPILVAAVVNVAAVFYSKNHDPEDVEKAVKALLASAFGVVSVFVTVDPNTLQTVVALVLAAVNVLWVHAVTNEPVPSNRRK